MNNRWKAIAGISAIFLLGGMCGALICGLVIREDVRQRQEIRKHEGFLEFFEGKLHLTETQRDSLRDELDTAYNRLAELRIETSTRFREVIDTLIKHVDPHLTPEQRLVLQQQEQKLRRMGPNERRSRPNGEGFPPPRRRPGDTGKIGAGVAPSPPDGVRPPEGRLEIERNPEMMPPRDAAGEQKGGSPRDSGDGPKGIFGDMGTLKSRLGLSSDQVTKIEAMVGELRARNKSAREDLSGNPAMRMRTIRMNNQEIRQKIEALLTDQQREELRTLMSERIGRPRK